jgi:hypothetical protein
VQKILVISEGNDCSSLSGSSELTQMTITLGLIVLIRTKSQVHEIHWNSDGFSAQVNAHYVHTQMSAYVKDSSQAWPIREMNRAGVHHFAQWPSEQSIEDHNEITQAFLQIQYGCNSFFKCIRAEISGEWMPRTSLKSGGPLRVWRAIDRVFHSKVNPDVSDEFSAVWLEQKDCRSANECSP